LIGSARIYGWAVDREEARMTSWADDVIAAEYADARGRGEDPPFDKATRRLLDELDPGWESRAAGPESA
jgi:hypothetical protein